MALIEERPLTYCELNRRANQLAHRLRALGVRPDVLVGICVKRSVEMIVGLLAILNPGGAYVPLDPGLPPSDSPSCWRMPGPGGADSAATPVLARGDHAPGRLSRR